MDHFTAWRAVERFFAEFFDLNNSKNSLLEQSPKMLIESFSQTPLLCFMLVFSISLSMANQEGVGSHSGI